MAETQKLFPGAHGLPTGPEVKQLLDQFGMPPEGLAIRHEEIAEVIGVAYKQPRYRSITAAWRATLYKDHALFLEAIPGEGFVVLTEREKVDEHEGQVKKGVRRIRVGATRIRMIHTEKLDEEGCKRALHVQAVAFRLLEQGLEATKALRPPRPPRQLSAPA